MLLLYTARNSICTQKVFITLAEKGLDYETRLVNLFTNEQYDPEYLKLNPKGVVPTLDHDGDIVTESTLICEYLDETFPEPSLMPGTPYARTQMRHFSKLIDEAIFESTREISFSAMFREKMKNMTEEQRQGRFRNVGDPERTARMKSTYETGVESPYVFQAIANWEKAFKMMNKALEENDGPWLLSDFSLADVNMIPYVARIDYLNLADIWMQGRPLVRDWWARCQERPSVQASIAGKLTDDEVSAMKTYGSAIRNRMGELRESYVAAA